MRPRHIAVDVNRGLADFAALAQRTAREQAADRMTRAKRLMSDAAQAAIDGRPDAADLGDRARAAVNAARLNLQRLEAEERGE